MKAPYGTPRAHPQVRHRRPCSDFVGEFPRHPLFPFFGLDGLARERSQAVRSTRLVVLDLAAQETVVILTIVAVPLLLLLPQRLAVRHDDVAVLVDVGLLGRHRTLVVFLEHVFVFLNVWYFLVR